MENEIPLVECPKVVIVILNWNGWRDTIECLESVYQISYPNYDVIVLDNGSEDESVEIIKRYCEGMIEVKSNFFIHSRKNKPIKIIDYTRLNAEIGDYKIQEKNANLASNMKLILIRNEKNSGFAEGNNIAIRFAMKSLHPDYVLLLNNDTTVDCRFLDELIKIGESELDIGIISPKIFFYKNPDLVWFAGGYFNWWKGCMVHEGQGLDDTFKYEIIGELEQITGCSMLIKSHVINSIGLLDKTYLLNYEDCDFCIRAKRSGFKLALAPHSHVWHKSGAGKRILGYKALYYISISGLFFYLKCGKRYLPYILVRYAFMVLYYFMIGEFSNSKAMCHALLDFLTGKFPNNIDLSSN